MDSLVHKAGTGGREHDTLRVSAGNGVVRFRIRKRDRERRARRHSVLERCLGSPLWMAGNGHDRAEFHVAAGDHQLAGQLASRRLRNLGNQRVGSISRPRSMTKVRSLFSVFDNGPGVCRRGSRTDLRQLLQRPRMQELASAWPFASRSLPRTAAASRVQIVRTAAHIFTSRFPCQRSLGQPRAMPRDCAIVYAIAHIPSVLTQSTGQSIRLYQRTRLAARFRHAAFTIIIASTREQRLTASCSPAHGLPTTSTSP